MKKIITMILTISMLLGSVVLYSTGEYVRNPGHGDIDHDGEVTMIDLFTLKSIVNQKNLLIPMSIILLILIVMAQ